MPSNESAVIVKDLYKSFKLPHEQHSGLKQLLLNLMKRKKGYEVQEVLRDLSFDIKKGEFFGIVGRNGSGKSTLLKLLAGIYVPDKGLVQVNGSLTPFIELGVGFNPELTGRENVFMNGALLGFGREEMQTMYDEIVEFAELERFMDQKLKNYSSGMQVRLAFSIAIRAQSDILLLDEVLAVGDSNFQQKCFDYFKELKKQKRTVILVSHDAGVLRQYCTSGVLIKNGKIICEGPISQVVNEYQESLVSDETQTNDQYKIHAPKKRWGNGSVLVEGAQLNDEKNNNEKSIFTDEDENLLITIRYQSKAVIKKPTLGITINDSLGHEIFASNTMWKKILVPDMKIGTEFNVTWIVPNVFNTGSYFINPAAADTMGTVIYDWREEMLRFKVRKKLESTAQTNISHQIHINTSSE